MPLILEAAKQNCDRVLNEYLNNQEKERLLNRPRKISMDERKRSTAILFNDVRLEDIESGIEAAGLTSTSEETEEATDSPTISAIMDELIDFEAFRGPSVMV